MPVIWARSSPHALVHELEQQRRAEPEQATEEHGQHGVEQHLGAGGFEQGDGGVRTTTLVCWVWLSRLVWARRWVTRS